MISTRKWIIIVAVLFLLALGGTIFVLNYSPKGTVAQIKQDGDVLYTIDLSKVTEPEYITVEYNGRENVICVQKGRICVDHADCPDGVCVDTGWIPNGAKSIVCLPNKLVISIVNADTSIDGATT